MALQLGALNYDNRLAAIERQLAELRAELRAEIGALRAYVDGRFNTLTWMIGATWAPLLVVIGKLFVH